jgi:hypothetical protein
MSEAPEITANYHLILNLAKLDNEDLIDHEVILSYHAALKFAAMDKTSVPTVAKLVETLRNSAFYAPSLIAYNGKLGFLFSTGFIEVNCNFALGKEIPSQAPSKDSPQKHVISFGEGYTVETSIAFLSTAKLKQMGQIEDLVDEAGATNQDALNLIISLIKPAPLTSLPEGKYTVKGNYSTEKSLVLILDGDVEISVAINTPKTVAEITSKNGLIYASKESKLLRGISRPYCLVPRLYGNEGEEKEAVGKKFQIQGVTTCPGEKSDYFAGKLSPISDDGVIGEASWCIIDASTSQFALNNLSKGKPMEVYIESIKTPTGNMKYNKVNLMPVR